MENEQPMMSIDTETEWMRAQASIERLEREGVSEKAFEPSGEILCCMDEGTPMGDLRSAGSGILTQGEERARFIAALKKAGVESVTSHEGCGAAALYRERHGLTDKSVDEVAMEGAKHLAAELGVPYGGHITELARPKGFHNARVVYADGIGDFNPRKVESLPPGFVVSASVMTQEQAVSEVALALKIAFGEHGFGEKFTPAQPLVVVALGDEALAAALQSAVGGEPRVKIVSFEPVVKTIQKAA